MNKLLISVSLLATVFAFAQEKKDSTNSKNIEEVIISSVLKKDSEYTNKMPLKAIENPQLFSTVDKIFFENQMIYTVDDAYRNVTGIQKMWSATNRAGDGGAYIALRGFVSNNSLRNGLVAPVTTSIDAVNVEKLEVLKGPSATLYGSNVTSYGGAVNRVTKKPYDKFGGNISLTGGSYNYYRAQADVNAPLTKDNKLLFRLNTAYTNSGTFQKTDAKNTYFAFTPSLLYKVNDKLDISLEYEMFETRATPEQSFFYLKKNPGYAGDPYYTTVDNAKDLEKLGLNYKQSYFGDGMYTTSKVRNLFGQINYKINNNIRSSTNVSSAYTFSDGYNPYFSAGLDSATNQIQVFRGDQSTDNSKKTYFQVQQNFNFDYKFGNGMRNRTVAGFDFMNIKNNLQYLYLSKGFFDSVPANGYDYAGTFNANTLAQAYQTLDKSTYNQYDSQNTYSGYIANVFTPISGLNIMAGIRYESNEFKGGTLWINPLPAYNQSAFSPKFGVVYEIINDKFSVFGNYQNSFKSNGYYISDNTGATSLSNPERANQFEGGFKGSIFKGKVNATLSYYNIKVKNTILPTTQAVLDGTGVAIPFTFVQDQAGKLSSEGIELEVNAYLLKGLSLVGGVSYNDSKFIESAPETKGRRPGTAGSPWLASLYASYQILDGKLKGLGFGLGGNYANDHREINNNIIQNGVVTGESIFILPKYLVLNASAFYDTKKYRIGVKVDNFTNQHYWVGFTTANPQQLINALGSFTYKF
ncbi:TonB-dependent receptor [Chryseobacterium sp. Ch-15]|uniref:TonB-dependent receptor n=1 Tax=Chryseobacterium muglaense TaxID=2893752 RepID=A0A9Q3YS03_9FLAO|nr:TonB-dependent receptor [Chryseobacterium muglaense]MBD3904334.1 TonB-dependent receptor [Chryseobacterium muglaense]MCC9035349.1 TonB-dependent receptor [Chryseobacterium muglaense]MCM2553986.1 TonB-dependent receptor [Chryseobacterium muglaense]